MNNYTEPPGTGFPSKPFPSYGFLDVPFSALRLKFLLSRFFFLIFTFCYLLLSYASQSASLNSMGDVYE